MADARGYTGCKTIIRDDMTWEVIAETTILEYDKRTQTISVDDRFFGEESLGKFEHVSLLILQKSAIYECKGSLRKRNGSGHREIAIFHRHEKEDRTTQRYVVNAPAKIENLVITGNLFTLERPMDVLVENISTKGTLIRTKAGILRIGADFLLKMNIGGSITMIHSTVVRIHDEDEVTGEYGCRFNFLCQK